MSSSSNENLVDKVVLHDQVFCGWKINHKEHLGTDIIDGGVIFVCPGYEWINDHA